MLSSRNSVWGFSERVRKNLLFLNFARNMEADVHVVTQLVTSLLGLIVFPYEEIKNAGYKGFVQYKVEDLSNPGAAAWDFFLGVQPDDLQSLLRHLRNAISHRRVTFSSESRALEEVKVTFMDRRPKDDADYWGASINARALLVFVLNLAALLHHIERNET